MILPNRSNPMLFGWLRCAAALSPGCGLPQPFDEVALVIATADVRGVRRILPKRHAPLAPWASKIARPLKGAVLAAAAASRPTASEGLRPLRRPRRRRRVNGHGPAGP